MWSGIGLEFSSCFKKNRVYKQSFLLFSASAAAFSAASEGELESEELFHGCESGWDFREAKPLAGFFSSTFGSPICLESLHSVTLPGTSFEGGLRMEPYGRVGSALGIFPVHPIFHMHCVCRCCLYVTHTLLFFREGSRSWNHLLATAKGCSARWVSCTGDSGMNKGVLVDVWEEEVSVQKLLRRLQEMRDWRDRKAIVGKIPVSMDVSLSC